MAAAFERGLVPSQPFTKEEQKLSHVMPAVNAHDL